ncbi:hypothetical protein WICPIJ_005930 [Wickerhamomyces pijperi]|uniref:Uncharacterized protein n=1 Tax=Wickerhamomyces pijperi TaxID=599730 RepID=A0A9P8TLH8_WICPI|nr:hypothetical protein WICPIJ_005930 [Wickerhamomyces pijperi]
MNCIFARSFKDLATRSTRRYYQSLAARINHDPTLKRLSFDYDNPKSKTYKEIQPHKNRPLKIRALQAQAHVSAVVGTRFVKLQEYLTEEYKLNAELLIPLIYTQQRKDMYIEIDHDGVKSSADINTIYRMGLTFYDLQSTLFLLKLSENNRDLNSVIDVAEHRIMKLFKSKEMLNQYVKLKRFGDFIVYDPKICGEKTSARYSFFTALGMLRLSYGDQITSKFLHERVFNGRNGVLELAISNL